MRLRTWLARWLFSRVRLYQGVELFDVHPRVGVFYASGEWGGLAETRIVFSGPVLGRNVAITVSLTAEQEQALSAQLLEARAARYLREHG